MELKPHERLDDLQIGGLSLIQSKHGFRFGIDAVLLSSFPEIKKGNEVFDMCTGSGIIPVLLSAKTAARKIYGMEIMPETADMARRSAALNNLANVEIITGDIRSAVSVFGNEVFDVITCNPPYKKADSGLVSSDGVTAAARHEILCTLEDVISQSHALLKFGGRLCMVHRPERLCDIICLMRAHNLEPKRLLFVHPSPGKAPGLVLVEGAKGGGVFLKILPPLYICDENGNYTDELNRIYGRSQ